MLRLSVRNRFQIPVPDERRAPHLTVIQGGLSFRKEHDVSSVIDIGPLVYLLVRRSWLESRRRMKAATTGVHILRSLEPEPEEPEPMTSREAYAAFLERETERIDLAVYRRAARPDRVATEPPKPMRSLYLSKRVLGQYVRRVLRHHKSLEDYLRTNAWELMKTEAFRHMSYELVRDHVFEKLTLMARDFARNALVTDRRTRKGYEIRTARVDRQDFVITFHHQQSVVIGVYTQARFDRLQKNASSRNLSSLKARVFRQNKPSRYCR